MMNGKNNCTSLADILKWFEELENQGHLSVTAEDCVRKLKFWLRFVKVLVKWELAFGTKDADCNLLFQTESLVRDAERYLIWPVRDGRMNAGDLDKRIYWLLACTWPFQRIAGIDRKCLAYFANCPETQIVYKDVVIDEVVLEWLDPLLENLKYLVSYTGLLASLKEQIKALQEKLQLIRDFLKITGAELEEITSFKTNGVLNNRWENLFTIIKALIENAIYFSHLCSIENEEMTLKSKLFYLQVKIRHIEPEIRMISVEVLNISKKANRGNLSIDLRALAAVDSLLDHIQELLNLEAGSRIHVDYHHTRVLHEELCFLKYFLMDPQINRYMEPGPQRLTYLLIQVEAMARKVASAIHICVSQLKRDKASGVNLLLHDLLEYVNLVKAEIKQIYPKDLKPLPSKFPRTPKLGFIDNLLQNLGDLLNYRADSIASVKTEFEEVQSQLVFLRRFLGDIMKQCKKPKELEDVELHLTNVALEAEFVIDLITANHGPVWYSMLRLRDIIERIKLLRTEVSKIFDSITCDIRTLSVKKVSNHVPRQANTLEIEEVVGFKDQAEKIIDQLTRGSKHRHIVSIVGMPGLGKTTLAKKVYECPSVTHYFHVRSWCCVSQVYERKELLLHLLEHVTGLTSTIHEMDDNDLAEVLYKGLKGKRYLIVMDDIWSIKAWNDLVGSFPDDENGSRIMFTSRHQEVALLAEPCSAPYYLRLLSKEESWELMQKKVFRQQSCPPELSTVGKQIAENCKGLPLSIVCIARVLRSTDKSRDEWEKIAKSLSKHIFRDPQNCVDILELSYNHLPDQLKPCFLYFGAFPKGKEISVQKLILLWIAEGLVQRTEGKSPELVAENYLMALISRSLVMVAKTRSAGGVKTCYIHDLVHEFCMEKVKQEKFLLLLHGNERNFPSSDGLECNVVSHDFFPINPEQHRLCFHSKVRDFNEWRPSDPYVRSVLFFPIDHHDYLKCFSPYANDFSFLSYSLKLLKVLDLGHINIGNTFLSGIELLVHLRYLAVQGEMTSIPSSIGNLWRLETFLVKGLRGEVKLPSTLWKMIRLKHVRIDEKTELPYFEPGDAMRLDAIETLSTPTLCYEDDRAEKILRRLPSLRKLKCIFLESRDGYRCHNGFLVLHFLTKLESLKVVYHGKLRNQYELNFPTNLKKLTLSNFRLPWSEISKIGRLPNLEVLKLLSRAFEGLIWDVSEEEFQNLRFLKLGTLNIAHWNASTYAFSRLEQLVLRGCLQLGEVPSSIGEISTLQIIEVQWCSWSAINSIRQIQEEQRDMGNDRLKVIIHPPDLDYINFLT